jgi:hypothetical protein
MKLLIDKLYIFNFVGDGIFMLLIAINIIAISIIIVKNIINFLIQSTFCYSIIYILNKINNNVEKK